MSLISFLKCLLVLLLLTKLSSAQFDYRDALMKCILFFEGQRSGPLDFQNMRNHWRGNSALNDGFAQGVNLTGGYYDAGDNVKFNFPMSFSMTMLAWSIIEYENQISKAGQLDYVREALRWGIDYLLKCHTEPNVFWAQVGVGKFDHSCWQRPEDMDTPRTAFKIDASKPGSELAGEAAAALAAASIVFLKSDPAYSQILLSHSKQLFLFADRFRGNYTKSIPDVGDFYNSWSGYMDELAWSATWLYKATNELSYFQYLVNEDHILRTCDQGMFEFSWDNKYAGVQILLSRFLFSNGQNYTKNEKNARFLQSVVEKASVYACAKLPKTRAVKYTPQGLIYIREVNMQYVVNAAFLLFVYSDYLRESSRSLDCNSAIYSPDEMFDFAKRQIDYMLGANKASKSYMVGFGLNYPKKLHHRGASTPSILTKPRKSTCHEGLSVWLPSKDENPNLHAGAIVGGPGENDDFIDDRPLFNYNEPSTYINAVAVGALAKLSAT